MNKKTTLVFVVYSSQPDWISWHLQSWNHLSTKTETLEVRRVLQKNDAVDTVDGRNPAPPGMYPSTVRWPDQPPPFCPTKIHTPPSGLLVLPPWSVPGVSCPDHNHDDLQSKRCVDTDLMRKRWPAARNSQKSSSEEVCVSMIQRFWHLSRISKLIWRLPVYSTLFEYLSSSRICARV